MENRKYLSAILFLFAILFSTSVYAYPTEVHKFITQEALKQYRDEISYNFNDNETYFIAEGAVHEDTTPRWMNHFFDPIYKRGLSSDPVINPFMPIGTWNSAQTWANSWNKQDRSLYKGFQMFSNNVVFTELSINKSESVYTWDKALYEWITGDKDKSLFILGHVLHLLQDMFVPDHTRNDAHPVSSPYEDYTRELLNRKEIYIQGTNNIPHHKTLEEYFISAALYSNKNFYSEDTIGIQSGYENPVPSAYEMYDERIILSRDKREGERKKVFLAIKAPKYGTNVIISREGVSTNDRKILESYWNELSPRALAYTAGAINFFFSEIEVYKNNPEELIQKEGGFFLGNILSSIEHSFSQIGENLLLKKENNKTYKFLIEDKNKEVSRVDDNKEDVSVLDVKDFVKKEQNEDIKVEEEKEKRLDSDNTEKKQTKNKESIIPCDARDNSPKYFPIVFSEIAWMGSTDSSSDEWIEIKNITSSNVSVSGWSIKNNDASITIVFDDVGINFLHPGEIILFERTDDDSVPHIKSDGIYKGSLRNSGDNIFLFDSNCRLIDAIIASDKWPAGDNISKKTMERDLETLEWYTSSRIHGTPKGINSKRSVEEDLEPTPTSTPGPTTQTPTPTPTPTSTPDVSENIIYADISISEIMYDLDGNDMGREWIEIRNDDEIDVLLDGWKFFEHGTYHNINHAYGDEKISPGEYAIIADKPEVFLNENPHFEGSIFDSLFSLSNEGELLAIYAGDILVDSYSYQSIQGGNGNGNSLQIYEGKWGEGFPSPGYKNNHNPIISEETGDKSVTIDHVVISEVQVSGEFGIEEFVEIYNPLAKEIDISEYSLQYASGRNENIGNVYKINLDGVIEGNGFILLANKDSSFAEIADKTFSFSLSGQDTGGIIMLVEKTDAIEDLDDDSIIDYVSYGPRNALPAIFFVNVPPDNKSIERRALYKGVCVSPLGNHEFDGNGCDRDREEDFAIRDEPFPQNSFSQKEPREKPSEVSSVSYVYDDYLRKVSLRWEHENDNSNFVIEDKGEKTVVYETRNIAFDVGLKELNTGHTISIYAKDDGGYLSEPYIVQENFFPESFIEKAIFYIKDSKATFDIFVSEKDFIPDFFGRGSKGALVLSINRNPLDGELIEISPTSDFSNWSDAEKNAVMKSTFRSCRGERTADMVPIYNVSGDCGIAYDVEMLEEGIIRVYPSIQWDPKLLTEDDYISISFYNLYSNWTREVYKNVGIDKKKYFFLKNTTENNIPPTPPQNVRIAGSAGDRYVLWDKSYDEDGFDKYIRYKIAIIPTNTELTESLWNDAYLYYSNGELRGPNIQYSTSGTYTIYMRAIDEFGSFSDLATIIMEI